MKTCLLGVSLLLALACIAEAEVRNWTDATGKYSTRAEMVEFKEGRVHLRKTDGTVITVPLEKLGAADQQYVRQVAAPSAPGTKATEPQEEAAAGIAPKPIWTMDLAKMKIPRGGAAGTVHGRDFVVERAELGNNILTLRQGKDFFPDLALTVFLFLRNGESPEGKEFRVGRKPGFGASNPHVHVQWREKPGDGLPEREMIMSDYAMVLQFGTKDAGKIPGRIYVCLPDKQKSCVAGSFTIVLDDETSEPGTGEIVGKLVLRGAAPGGTVWVGCLGKNPQGKLEEPGVGIELSEPSPGGTSLTWRPRNTILRWDKKSNSGIHKHVNRPPGQYLVFARASHTPPNASQHVFDGYFDAKWVQIKEPGESVSVDLSIDPAALGSLEITVRGATREPAVVCVPLDAAGQLPFPDAAYFLHMASAAKLEGGKALVRFLREGKYLVAIGPWERGAQPGVILAAAKAEVEVKRGATTKVELTPPPAVSARPPITPAPRKPIRQAEKETSESGLPDLQVTQVYLQKEGFMRALVKNSGTARAANFSVAFFVDGKLQSTRLGMGVKPSEQSEASAVRLPTGTHAVKVVADPDNQIQESDETNNSKEAVLSRTE